MSGTLRAKNYAVYLEDTPLRADVAGQGLARVNAAVLAGLAPRLDRVVLGAIHDAHRRADWDPRFAELIKPIARWRILGMKGARRLGGAAADAFTTPLLIGSPLSGLKYATSWLFVPVGSDLGTAERARVIARRAGLRLALYFVDNPVSVAAPRSVGRTSTRFATAARSADLCFAITDMLTADVTAAGGRCRTLALPFESRPVPPADTVAPMVVHIGAINHIYRSGLITVARAMATCGGGLTLRLTVRPDDALLSTLRAEVPVEIAPAIGPGALERLLADALCAVVPVEPEPSGMYASSFPSKLLEYLNACSRIVALGSEESSAVRYFRDHGLADVASDGTTLAATIAGLRAEPVDRSESYRAVLHANHAPGVFGRIVEDALDAAHAATS